MTSAELNGPSTIYQPEVPRKLSSLKCIFCAFFSFFSYSNFQSHISPSCMTE